LPGHRPLARQVGGTYRKPDRERRSPSQHALDADVATQQTSEATGDGEAEAGPSLHRVTPRTRVDLLELIEDPGEIGGRDADSTIDHLKGHPDAAARRAGEKGGRGGIVHPGAWSGGPAPQLFRRSQEAGPDAHGSRRRV